MNRCLSAIVLLLLVVAPAPAQDRTLKEKIEEVINAPTYKQTHWGILAVDAKTGATLFEVNPDKMFAPASTTKLYSCSTALAALGPDYVFETPVYSRGTLKDGKLTGDLVLVAQGDLTLGGRTDANGRIAFKNDDHTYANGNPASELTDTDPLAGLKELARKVAASGIGHVTGEILIDDRLFDHARGSGSGPDAVTPIVVNDNVVDAVVEPAAKAGDPAKVRMRPETNFIQMDAQVETVGPKADTRIDIVSTGPRSFSIRGQIAAGRKPLVRIFAVDNPAAFARALFIETLRREGVRVAASPLATSAGELPAKGSYDKLTKVATFRSPPFSEVIKVTLKVSHNLYASTLPLLVAVKNGKRTLADGLGLQRKFLAEQGVDVDTISFGGGAGGASSDATTPRATVQLLQGLAKRPEYRTFHDALPVLGQDGTLATSVPADSPAKGKAFAKTGTLSWSDLLNNRTLVTSKALAGTLTTRSGQEVVFAMFMNRAPLPKGATAARDGRTLGKICEILFER